MDARDGARGSPSSHGIVVILVGLWVPVLVARHYADGPGWAEVGRCEVIGMEVRLPRHPVVLGARLGASDAALDRARDVWAGSPPGRERRPVYQDGPFARPVPGGRRRSPRPTRRAPSRSRAWAGSCAAACAAGREQMIGLLDYHSGRVAWNIRPLPAAP